MKQVHPNYTFVASTKTITLTGLNIAQDQLLLITNATRGVIYYNFASSSHRAVVTAGANTTVVLTDASTIGHANEDQLVIHYDDQLSTQAISGTVTANTGLTQPLTDAQLRATAVLAYGTVSTSTSTGSFGNSGEQSSAIDCSGYDYLVQHITGGGGGYNRPIQWSNNNVNWTQGGVVFKHISPAGSSSTGNEAHWTVLGDILGTSSGIFVIPVVGRYFRLGASAGGGGSWTHNWYLHKGPFPGIVEEGIGARNSSAATTDTSDVGLNGLFKRLLQRLTTLLPANLTVSSTRLLVDGSGVTQPISGTVTANSPSLNFDSQLFTGMQLVTDATLTFNSSTEVLYAGLNSQTAASAVAPSTAVKGRCFLVRLFNDVASGATIQGAFHGMGSRPSFLPNNTFSFRLGNAATNLGFYDEAITINSDNISNYYLFVAGVSEPEFGPGSLSISGLAAFNLNFGLHRVTGSGVTRVQIYSVPMPPEAALNTVIHNNLRRFLGRTTDSAASSDSESGSFVSQFKRLQGKIPSLSSGRVPIDGSAVTQPVSAASLPLPSGAATSANQTTANTSLSNIDTNIGALADSAATTDIGSFSLIGLFKRLLQRITALIPSNLTVTSTRLLVDGSGVTQPISGTVTANGGNFLNADNALITKDSASNLVLVGGINYSANPTQSAIDAIRTDGSGAVLVYSGQTNWTDTNAGGQARSASQQTPFPVQVIQNLPIFDALTLSGASLVTDATISFTSGQILWAGTNANQSTALDPAGVKGRAFLVKFHNNGASGASMQGQFFGAGTLTGSLLNNNPSYKVQPVPRGFNNSPIAVAADNVSTYYLFMAGLKPFLSGASTTLEALPFDLNFGVYTTSGTGSGRIEIYKINIPSELALNSVIHGNLREWLLSPTVTANTGLTQPLTDAQLRATAVTTYPQQGSTVSNTNFSSLTSAELAPAVANRESLTVYNEAGTLLINVGASASTTSYQVRLLPGDYWEAPAGQQSLQHSAIFSSAGTARVTQVS